MDDEYISVEEFVEVEEKDLQRFLAYWTKKSEEDPIHFHRHMEFDDWSTQFDAFSVVRG